MANPPNDQSCAGCKFWFETGVEGEKTRGVCRAHPPVNIPSDGGAKFTSQFPVMFSDGWCGEFSDA